MTNPREPHMHLPQRDDPNHCGVDGCGMHFSDAIHAPAGALRRLSQLPPDLQPLAQHERASGSPSVPAQRWHNDAAPATHTGRPSMHSGSTYIPADALWIMCPMRSRVPGRLNYQCPFTSQIRAEVADHLSRVHKYGAQAIGFYLAHPWFANEDRRDWVKRTSELRGAHLLKTQKPVEEEFCDHPNGFGPNGCPCGASAPNEGDPETLRNIGTGEDVPATRCPECHEAIPNDKLLTHMRDVEAVDQTDLDEMADMLGLMRLAPPDSPIWNHQIECPECENAVIKGNARTHLQTAHGWTGQMWEDWAESVNFLELPTVPKSIIDDIEALGKRAEAELARFMSPDVSMEDIMTDANAANAMGLDGPEEPTNGHKLDPHELEAALTAWWMKKADQEASAVVPKAVEYGATDLRDIGRDLADCMGREVTDEEATELGIFFYLRGKLSRWVDAVKRGDRPSDDTIYDIGVYCRMAQRNRDAGGWPGLPKS